MNHNKIYKKIKLEVRKLASQYLTSFYNKMAINIITFENLKTKFYAKLIEKYICRNIAMITITKQTHKIIISLVLLY